MKKNESLTLSKEFLLYCELNHIKDPVRFAETVFEKGFNLVKYGEAPAIKGVKLSEILSQPVQEPFIPVIEPPVPEKKGVVMPDKKTEIKKDLYGE